MGRIKIKDMEGDEADLLTLFQKSGCSLAGYLKIDDQKKIPVTWLWITLAAFFILACCVWNSVFSPEWERVAILGLFLLSFLLILLIHFNFRNWHLTIIVGLGVLIILSIAINLYSPGEVTRKIGKVVEKKLENQ
jgi:hypothetical protein